MKCKELLECLEKLAPISLAEKWDNPGLLVGDTHQEIKKVLVALDVTDDVIDEAIKIKADVIITHHPLLFSAVKKITNETPIGKKLSRLIKNDISHIALHTNLDIAFGGTNDVLAELIGLKNIQVLSVTEEIEGQKFGLGRIGELEKEENLENIAKRIKEKLSLDTIRFVGNNEAKIKKIGLCTGSGFEFMQEALKHGAHAYVTSDIRYHESQKALDLGIAMIDATHYGSENIIVPTIKRFIDGLGEKIEVVESKVDGQVFKHI